MHDLEGEKWLISILEEFRGKNDSIGALEQSLDLHTSTRLFDWIDHFTVEGSGSVESELQTHGFEVEITMPAYRVFHHPTVPFPRLLVRDAQTKHPLGIAIRVESLGDFLMARGLSSCIEGSPLSPYRRALISEQEGVALMAVERRGSRTMEPTYSPEGYLDDYLSAKERWQSRPRGRLSEEEEFKAAFLIAEEMVSTLGADVAATIVLDVERSYWQQRNCAGQMQRTRQERIGLGWGNFDHHTFRSSRRHFTELVRLFETLGFRCQEHFFSSEEKIWATQVMENANAGLSVHLDVDLAPEELETDFAHHPLPQREQLNSVGLWCGLHGDSILEAGLHSLACRFNAERLRNDLQAGGIEFLPSQTLTQAEIWHVVPERLDALHKLGLVTQAEADRYLTEGAPGSHLGAPSHAYTRKAVATPR